MKKRLSNKGIAAFLPVLLIMATVVAGCALNQSPTAYIDSIVPGEVAQGEAVAFTGHGTDSDGTVVAYRQLHRSQLEAILSPLEPRITMVPGLQMSLPLS